MRVANLAALQQSFYVRVPVTTIFPEAKISVVEVGLRRRIMTALKRCGLYYAFLVEMAIYVRLSSQLRLTVATILWRVGFRPSGIGTYI